MIISASRAQSIFDLGRGTTFVYLIAVGLLIVRLEMLRKQRRLPEGYKTFFSPVPSSRDTWDAIWNRNRNQWMRMGRVLRVIFTGDHEAIRDSWVSGLVFACRILLVASVVLFAANFLPHERT